MAKAKTRAEAKAKAKPKVKGNKPSTEVSAALVVHMAERMHMLNPTMRENMVARARKRIEAGHGGKNDAAIVRVAGG